MNTLREVGDRFTVSVVVCTYNRSVQVAECVTSLLARSGENFVVLVVDDGSTDDTQQQLGIVQAQHPTNSIIISRNPTNLGLSAARNVGIAAAGGDIILFTDSDCVVDPDWLRHMIAAFEDPAAVAVAGVSLDHPPRTYAEAAYVGTNRLGVSPVQNRALVGNCMGFRQETLQTYGFDKALTYYCDDDDLAWRLISDGHKIAFAPAAVVRHDHPMTVRKYLRMARLQGRGSGRFWYKQGKYVGRDILPTTLGLLTLPLGLLSVWLLLIPAFFASAQLAALVYNQHALKGKSLGTAVKVLPLEIAYSACKTASVYFTLLRIALGYEPEIVRSKREWWSRQKSRGDGRPAEGEGGEQLRDDGRG